MPADKPKVIGIYGLPGSGKSTLKQDLAKHLGTEKYEFYEGSQKVIDMYHWGDLEHFKQIPESQKEKFRSLAIKRIAKECAEGGKVGVVTGHFMFWNEDEEAPVPVWTSGGDANVYTHIIYLDIEPKIIRDQRENDTDRERPEVSIEHLCKWQNAEKKQLRKICFENGILFTAIRNGYPPVLEKAYDLVNDFYLQDETYNMKCAMYKLHQAMWQFPQQPQRMLVFDADKTLTPLDTGKLFWAKEKHNENVYGVPPLDELFSTSSDQAKYSYSTFRQAQLMYDEVRDDFRFDTLRKDVAALVESELYADFVDLLKHQTSGASTGVVIVTCGLHHVWDTVIQSLGLSNTVKVIGAGRITTESEINRFVVTPEVKAEVVARLQQTYKAYVWTFGDSPVDIDMLHRADQAIIVVGEETSRSKSMDAALKNSIINHGLRARQILLPSDVTPRLNGELLPVTTIEDVVKHEIQNHPAGKLNVVHATDRNASKLLARDTRDSRIAGPHLREAHREMGWYLSTEFLTNIIGLEKVGIPHVQGGGTIAHRLLHEERTLIVPLMRGGEPMAMGVSDAFPLASFLHAKEAEHITRTHVHGRSTIILVDGVVNTGQSLIPLIKHIRELHRSIRIVVVAGVVQEEAVQEDGVIANALDGYGTLDLVALRLSKNKFKGHGGTDTGHRLFNTVYLEE